jgi:hypothetical protein
MLQSVAHASTFRNGYSARHGQVGMGVVESSSGETRGQYVRIDAMT